MGADFEARIARLASDRESGASEILDAAIAILRDALAARTDVPAIARAICRAQPSMAPLWNAALAAVASINDITRFERFAHRVARAPDALARFALDCFAVDQRGTPGPMHVVTISFSRSVAHVLEALHRRRPLRAFCSESRPALEGRRLATRLASLGIPVTCFTDPAIAHALDGAHAVIVGADAIGPEWFLNKSGTRMLAAAASQQGTPVYVVASRDKFVSDGVAARLQVRDGDAAEVWDQPPSGVLVLNPYFETIPLDSVTGVITDTGVLGAGMVSDVCKGLTATFPLTL